MRGLINQPLAYSASLTLSQWERELIWGSSYV